MIQYAVTVLGVQDIIVCSHSYCGACAALFNLEKLEEDEEAPQLRAWLRLGERARDLALSALGPDAPREQLLRTTEKLAAVCQLEHLMTHPYVRRRVDEGKLFLHGGTIRSSQATSSTMRNEHDWRSIWPAADPRRRRIRNRIRADPLISIHRRICRCAAPAGEGPQRS